MNVKVEIKSPSMELKLFLDNLNFCYLQFCYLEEIRGNNFSELIFAKNPEFWQTIRISLLRSYLLELAKIFEREKSKFAPVLSVYYLLDHEFRGNKKTLGKLNKLRNKFLAHQDLKSSLNLKQFLTEIDLKPEEISQLFEKIYQVVSKIFQNQGLRGDSVNSIYEEIRKRAIENVLKLLNA